MHKTISSSQNPAIKRLLQLQEKSRLRRKENLFVIEGRREISLALKAKFRIREVYFCPDFISSEELAKMSFSDGILLTEISSEVYQKIAYRDSTEGIIVITETREFSLDSLQLKNENPLLLVSEAPEKPGNIGALLRTADAAGVDAVLLANLKTDLFNPNIIRSSVGCVFTNSIAIGSSSEIIQFLKSRKVDIYAAALQASKSYSEVDFSGPSAIVVGTEATGLEDLWLENSTQNIVIPMSGEIDSMNLSVAAGILIFEAKRQRGF